MTQTGLELVGPVLDRPVMSQRWDDVVFLHWRYDPAEVQRLLPAGVEVDVFDGAAWVALVPFRMLDLALPGGRRLPFGTFPEVNVRTYVRSRSRRGVWFFSLDIDRVAPTAVARAVYRLPYCVGRVDHVRVHDLVSTRVERRWPAGERPITAELTVRTGDPLDAADPLARFLTARWGLISARPGGRPRWAPVEHPVWPLHDAELVHLEERLVTAAGLTEPEGEPHVMWSPGVDVRVGRPVRV
jgi:uncharacterized protein YqjF (DUF2071 family)